MLFVISLPIDSPLLFLLTIMKSLKDYSLRLSEQDYHNYPAWSYSKIAKYAKNGFAAIATLDEKQKPTAAMVFGSLFDCMLTQGSKATKAQYAVFDRVVPDAEKRVLDTLVSTCTASYFEALTSDEITTATEACQYYPKWGYDAKYKHLVEYADYYLAKRSGKTLVTPEEWSDAFTMMSIFRNDEYLKDLFGTKSSEDVEYIYQAKYVVDYTLPSGQIVPVKIMPDLIKVNHKAKTVQLVDLKTSGDPAWNFKENFVRLAYYIQAKLYSDVMRIIMDDDEDYRSYTLLPYLFTDISRTDKVPVTYVYDQTDPSQFDGFTFSNGERTYSYKGWQTLLCEILDYQARQATVPSYIRTDGPNDLLDILGRN